MKKFLSLILIIILCCSFSACGSPASSPIEDFEYEFEDGTVTITGYIGTDLEIVIPDTIEKRPVTVIGEEAFMNYDMTSIVIPEGITTIDNNAFTDCNNLESIVLPDSLYYISTHSGLDDTSWYENQSDGILYINNILYEYKNGDRSDAMEEIKINNGTKVVADGAFSNCKNITSVSMPDSLEHIGKEAFYGCNNLKSINLSNNLKSIDLKAFFNCTNLNSMDIPESVESIENDAIGYNGSYYMFTTQMEISRNKDFIIYGKSGSEAENYANNENINFVAK